MESGNANKESISMLPVFATPFTKAIEEVPSQQPKIKIEETEYFILNEIPYLYLNDGDDETEKSAVETVFRKSRPVVEIPVMSIEQHHPKEVRIKSEPISEDEDFHWQDLNTTVVNIERVSDSSSPQSKNVAKKKTSTANSSRNDGEDRFKTEQPDKLPDISRAVQRTGGNIPASLFEGEKYQRSLIERLGGYSHLPLKGSPMYLNQPQTEERKKRDLELKREAFQKAMEGSSPKPARKSAESATLARVDERRECIEKESHSIYKTGERTSPAQPAARQAKRKIQDSNSENSESYFSGDYTDMGPIEGEGYEKVSKDRNMQNMMNGSEGILKGETERYRLMQHLKKRSRLPRRNARSSYKQHGKKRKRR